MDIVTQLPGWISFSVNPFSNGRYDVDFACIIDGQRKVFYSSTIKKRLSSIPKLEDGELDKVFRAGVDFLVNEEKKSTRITGTFLELNHSALSTSFIRDEFRLAHPVQTNPLLPLDE